MKTLVIGYGNPLRGDDRAGAAVADRVRRACPDVVVLTPHQLLPELAVTLASVDAVVFVDAGVLDEPGRITCEPVWGIAPGDAHRSHILSPAALLHLTADLYGTTPAAWLIRIGAESFDFGAPLSPAVSRSVRAAADRAIALVHVESTPTAALAG